MDKMGKGLLKAIVIVGVVFALAYFISYNKWANHNFNAVDITYNSNQNEEFTENNNTEVEKDSTKDYKTLYSKLSYELLEYNFGEEFYDIYYNNKPFYDEYFIYVGIINILKNDMLLNCNLQTSIEEKVLKDEIKSIFGNVIYSNKSFTTKNGNVIIEYDPDNNKYNIKLNGKCSGSTDEFNGIKNIYLKGEETINRIYLYDRAYYLESYKDKSGNLFFKYHKGIDKDSEIIATDYNKFDLEVLPTYKYTFIKEDNEIRLDSIKRK